jgi:plastocyanin
VGDTVRWRWDSGGHDVVSGSGGNADDRFCSPNDRGCNTNPLSNAGATYEHTFAQAGTFPYFCRPHASFGMTGRVIVEP